MESTYYLTKDGRLKRKRSQGNSWDYNGHIKYRNTDEGCEFREDTLHSFADELKNGEALRNTHRPWGTKSKWSEAWIRIL